MSCSYDKTIKIWDFDTGKLLKSLEGHEEEVCCVSFSPNGDYIASGSEDTTIKIWNMNNCKQL